MYDLIFHEATFIGHTLDGHMIRNGAAFDKWLIGVSDSDNFEVCMEAVNNKEAKKSVDFLIKLRGLKIDPDSKEGKFVYLKPIT
jgi:hypothetical protein